MINVIKDTIYRGRKDIQIFTAYILLVALVYLPMFNSYFQQDEWFFMAYYNQFRGLLWPFVAFAAPFIDLPTFSFHFTPLGSLLYGGEFRIFWIHFELYVLSSIFLHSINCFLIYKFILKISRLNLVATVASIFFACSASILEATYWVGAHIQVQLALTFYLISIIEFSKHLINGKSKNFYVSLFFYFFSIITKETVSLLIITYPMLVLILKSKQSLLKIKSFYFAFAIYLLTRFSYPIFYKIIAGKSLYSSIIVHSNDPLFLFYYTISLILKAGAQLFFGGINFLYLSEVITDIAYKQYTAQKSIRGTEYLTFTQSASYDIVFYLLSIPFFIIVAIILTRYFFHKEVKHFRILIFSLAVFIGGILPLTILSGWLLTLFSYISSIESRQLYIPALGVSILIGYLALTLKEIGDLISFNKKKIGYFIVALITIVWCLWQISFIHNQIKSSNLYAKDRREIIKIWLSEKDKLGKNTIFYSQSNVALYGFAELMLPFQNNPGQVILSVYGNKQELPKNFLTHKNLARGLTEQWYESYEGIGIGYFLNKRDLIRIVKDKKIDIDDIVSVKYDGLSHSVTNTTADFRSELKSLMDEIKEVSNWKKYTNKEYDFEFYYPNEYVLERTTDNSKLLALKIYDPSNNALFAQIDLYKKGEFEGVSDKAMKIFATKDYLVRNLKVGYTTEYTSILIPHDIYDSYMFNSTTNKEMKSITKLKDEYLNEETRLKYEKFLKFLEFYN